MKHSEKIMHILHKILWGFAYALPAVLFLSYYPVISLGGNNSMNFELSIPLLWLAVFDVLAFVWLIWWGITQGRKGKRNFEGITDRRFFLLALFPLYLTISVLWSANQLRGLLTSAVVWAIFFAVFAILFVLPLGGAPRKLRTHVLLVFFIATVLVCKFCFAQSIMDILEVNREHTLLCLGCTYRSFGFPHPSGFAIEPQFMGNLLLAPALTAMYLVVFRERKAYKRLTSEVDKVEDLAEQHILHKKIKLPRISWAKWQHVGLIILAGFISMTLFFTFSRGAIYAYAVALLVLLIFALMKRKFRWSLIAIPVVSLVLALALQGTFAAVGPTAETFVSAVTKSIHQLSLGMIDLRPSKTGDSVDNSTNTVDNSAEMVENEPETVDKAEILAEKPSENTDKTIFDGYVAESTNIRLNLNSVALKTWLAAPGHQYFKLGFDCPTEEKISSNDHCKKYIKISGTSILFGVGLGGAGTAMHEAYPEEVTSPKEIVQHEGFSLLLESGLVGIGLAIFGLLIAFFPRIFTSKFIDGRLGSAVASRGAKPVAVSRDTELVNANNKPAIADRHLRSNTKVNKRPDNLFWRHPALPLMLALVIAYLVTLNFFSGLPNALQIYLMPPLLYLIFQSRSEVRA